MVKHEGIPKCPSPPPPRSVRGDTPKPVPKESGEHVLKTVSVSGALRGCFMYQIVKYGIMVKHEGIPIYAGNRLISHALFVWWWPVNWVMLPIGAVIVATRMVIRWARHA